MSSTARRMSDEDRERSTLPPPENEAFNVVLSGLRQIVKPLEGKIDKLGEKVERLGAEVRREFESVKVRIRDLEDK
jgi:hypothetical protein